MTVARADELTLHLQAFESDEQAIAVGSSDWYAWLDDARHRAFVFESRRGPFTARKERRQRGGWYWMAYRRVDGQLRKAYLGKSEALSLEHLEVAGARLAGLPSSPGATSAPSPRSTAGGLLATKLHVPRGRPRLVPRPRLLARLDEGMAAKLTLVSAPAGFGKTTLLAEWSEARHWPVAWVSLDEADADPARFWTYVVGALDTVYPGLAMQLAPLLEAPRTARVEPLLGALINAAVAFPEDVALVLDDYHAAEAPGVDQGVAFLLDHLPSRLHVVISTREAPQLPLARLRGRGQMVEIRASDLRYTSEEADAFLEGIGLSLDGEAVAALEAQTEGWFAGLHLVGLALQGGADVADLTSSGHQFVLDYLAEEVLEGQTEDVRAFLLRTSILDRLCGPLCDAVTGQPGSREMLARLERANLFLVPLDSSGNWYRYHRVFGDFLRLRLVQTASEEVSQLHSRAMAWLGANGLPAAAVEHSLAAADFEAAARLIEQVARPMLMRNEISTLASWLGSLPDEVMRLRPGLGLARAWVCLGQGKPDGAESWGRVVEQSLAGESGTTADAYRGELAAVRATLPIVRGDGVGIVEQASLALELLPPDDDYLRCVVSWQLGQGYRFAGKAVEAERAFAEAHRLARACDNYHFVVLSLSSRAHQLAEQARLREAARVYRQAQAYATAGGRRPTSVVGEIHIGLAEILREWNLLEDASRELELGLQMVREAALFEFVVVGLVVQARIRQAMGDSAAAESIREAWEIASSHRPQRLAWIEAWDARLHLAEGALADAVAWAERCGLDSDDDLTYRAEDEYAALARVLLARGEGQRARRLARRLAERARLGERSGRAVEYLMLEAEACQIEGDHLTALESLGGALALAEPEGYVRLFVDEIDEGAPLATLLGEARGQGISPHYAARLLRVSAGPDHFGSREAIEGSDQDGGEAETTASGRGPSSPTAMLAISQDGLLDPLSGRELQVLRLVAANMPNQEIAHELVVSVNTVKAHVKNIYRKLSVGSRREAAARARALRLL